MGSAVAFVTGKSASCISGESVAISTGVCVPFTSGESVAFMLHLQGLRTRNEVFSGGGTVTAAMVCRWGVVGQGMLVFKQPGAMQNPFKPVICEKVLFNVKVNDIHLVCSKFS